MTKSINKRAALMLGVLFCTAAAAQNTATQRPSEPAVPTAQPAAKPGQPAGAGVVAPSAETLDANAQRAHSREPGPAPAESATTPPRSTVQQMDDNAQRAHRPDAAPGARTAQSGRCTEQQATGGSRPTAATGNEVRNWAAIDKNKNHLIEPDEMQAYLDEGRAGNPC